MCKQRKQNLRPGISDKTQSVTLSMTIYYDGIKFQNQMTGAQNKLRMSFMIKEIKTK